MIKMNKVRKYSLKWVSHKSTVMSAFTCLFENEKYADCTLAAEGRFIKVHQVMMSACSPYLERLLEEHSKDKNSHPIVIFNDLSYFELKALCEYMYKGEVNVPMENLKKFLKIARVMQIRGLSNVIGGDSIGEIEKTGSTEASPVIKRKLGTAVFQSAKRKRRNGVLESPALSDHSSYVTSTPKGGGKRGMQDKVMASCSPRVVQDVRTTCSQDVQEVETTYSSQDVQEVKTSCSSQDVQEVIASCSPQMVQEIKSTCSSQDVPEVIDPCSPQMVQEIKTTCSSQDVSEVIDPCSLQMVQEVKSTCFLQDVQDVNATCCSKDVQELTASCPPQIVQEVNATYYQQELKATCSTQVVVEVKDRLKYEEGVYEETVCQDSPSEKEIYPEPSKEPDTSNNQTANYFSKWNDGNSNEDNQDASDHEHGTAEIEHIEGDMTGSHLILYLNRLYRIRNRKETENGTVQYLTCRDPECRVAATMKGDNIIISGNREHVCYLSKEEIQTLKLKHELRRLARQVSTTPHLLYTNLLPRFPGASLTPVSARGIIKRARKTAQSSNLDKKLNTSLVDEIHNVSDAI